MIITALDDEELALEYLVSVLKSLEPEAEIYEFQYAKDLIEFARNKMIDVAFVDIQLSGEDNGVEVARKLQQIQPEVNLIFCTAYEQYGLDAIKLHASGYLLKPVSAEAVQKELQDLRYKIKQAQEEKLHIRCFGNFEVFDDKQQIVRFERTKSKEAFAYLVHLCGASCTTRELAAVLFEDAPYDDKAKAYIQKIVRTLEKALEKAGAAGVLRRERNSMAIDMNMVECDLYLYMRDHDGKNENNPFEGEYMLQYGWAEVMPGNFVRRTF